MNPTFATLRPTECPPRDTLQAFSDATLPDADAESVAIHVSNCTACAAKMAHLINPEDTLMSELRRLGGTHEHESRDENYEEQMAALELLSTNPIGVESVRRGAAEHSPPRHLREYRLMELLGQGGMGTVYRALHTRLDRIVAIKLLAGWSTSNIEAISRFCREIKAVARLRHPNIVQATDAGEIDGTHFLVMEYIEGVDLAKLIRQRVRLRIADACAIAMQTAAALAHAHAHGLIHRDVKPSNLMLTPQGQVKLLDLGLARFQEDRTAGEFSTQSHVVMGSVDYMAPEQADHAASANVGADLYSLGCTLYQMVAGETPYPTSRYTSPMQKLKAHANVVAPTLKSLRPETPAELSKLVEKLMSKDPSSRPLSALEVLEALQPFANGADLVKVYANPEPDVIVAGNPVRRRSMRVWVVALAAGVLAVVLAAGLVIRLMTDSGLVEVITNVDDVKVTFEGDGTIEVVDVMKNRLIRLKPGDYRLSVANVKGTEVSPNHFKLLRGGNVVVSVRRIGGEAKIVKDAGKGAAPLDPNWLTTVASLPAKEQVDAVAAELKSRNPEFDGNVSFEPENETVIALSLNSHYISDISPVRALSKLKSLNCIGLREAAKGRLRDLRPLQGLPLEQLNVGYNDLTDITPLKDMPLVSLNCTVTTLGDLSVLKSLKNLVEFSCHGTGQKVDLTPLQGLPLKSLNVGGTKITDLSPLKGMPLEILNLAGSSGLDLTPIKGSRIRHLFYSFGIDDGPTLRSLKQLERLNDVPVREALEKGGVAE